MIARTGWQKTSSFPFLSLLISFVLPPSANAMVDLATWRRAPILALSPRSETARYVYIAEPYAELQEDSKTSVRVRSGHALVVGIVPWTETFLAGLSMEYGMTALSWMGPPEGSQAAGYKIPLSQSYVHTTTDATAIFVVNDMTSVLVQATLGSDKGPDISLTKAGFVRGLTYIMHAFADTYSLGLAIYGEASSRNKSALPLLGFVWMPTPAVRFDGWFPAFVYLTWDPLDDKSVFLFGRASAVSESYLAGKGFAQDPENGSAEVALSEVRSLVGVGARFSGAELEAGVGYASLRSVSIKREGSPTYKAKPEPSLLMRLQLSLKL